MKKCLGGGKIELSEPETNSKINSEDSLSLLPAVQASVEEAEVTRIQWLHEVTTLFEMTVEENNYPDNYYSDMNTESEYYYDVMLATEFGLIDVEPGCEMRPQDPATREFAAHTLNLCLGYTWEEGGTYTFSEADSVTYPEDIQIAIDHQWLELTEGNFYPENPITKAEMDKMLADAKEVFHSVEIDANYNNQYNFAEGVVVLSEGTEAELTDEEELTIYDCPIALENGTIFAVIMDGFPVVRKAASITITGNQTIVQTQSVSMEESFQSIDIEGQLNADLSKV